MTVYCSIRCLLSKTCRSRNRERLKDEFKNTESNIQGYAAATAITRKLASVKCSVMNYFDFQAPAKRKTLNRSIWNLPIWLRLRYDYIQLAGTAPKTSVIYADATFHIRCRFLSNGTIDETAKSIRTHNSSVKAFWFKKVSFRYRILPHFAWGINVSWTPIFSPKARFLTKSVTSDNFLTVRDRRKVLKDHTCNTGMAESII